jgi:hypothetical protein
VTVSIRLPDGTRARIRFGVWSADDPDLVAYLTRVVSDFELERTGYIPDHDLAIAEYVVERLGGRRLPRPRASRRPLPPDIVLPPAATSRSILESPISGVVDPCAWRSPAAC